MEINPITSQADLLRSLAAMKAGIVAPDPHPEVDDPGRKQVDFSEVMLSALDAIDQQQHQAAAMQTAVETGQSDDLVGTMIASQKAGLSFAALVQVRNRLVSAFDDIMNMPV